ncbi:MAG: site-2 protease family protein [Acidobacteriota bacterium]
MSDSASGRPRTWLHALLFGLTGLTAWFAGLIFASSFLASAGGPGPGLFDPRVVGTGFLYALALLIILVGHELGHYLTCRRYGVPATLPYFLPGPPFLGTFGAFIRIKAPVLFKRQIFDVGANGPLAGFVLAVPALAVGLAFSKVGVVPATPDTIAFGEPLLFRLLSGLIFGRLPEGASIILHPVGFAGWVGLLVTALNLIPIGQLDGGHVAYALLGRRARVLSRIMVAFLAVMGVFFHLTWLILAALILVFEFRSKMRLRHPPVLDEDAPLGRKRTILAVILALVFILSFVPDPVRGAGLLDLLKGAPGVTG